MTQYGLKFTYHSGKDEDKYYSSENKRNSVFDVWKRKLNKPGYNHPYVVSVMKIQK